MKSRKSRRLCFTVSRRRVGPESRPILCYTFTDRATHASRLCQTLGESSSGGPGACFETYVRVAQGRSSVNKTEAAPVMHAPSPGMAPDASSLQLQVNDLQRQQRTLLDRLEKQHEQHTLAVGKAVKEAVELAVGCASPPAADVTMHLQHSAPTRRPAPRLTAYSAPARPSPRPSQPRVLKRSTASSETVHSTVTTVALPEPAILIDPPLISTQSGDFKVVDVRPPEDKLSPRRGLGIFDSRRFHAHDQCLVKMERDLNKTQRELDKTRSQLNDSQQKARAAREATLPLQRRVRELEAALLRERSVNTQLVSSAREREDAYKRETTQRAERYQAHLTKAEMHWNQLENELREEHAATVNDYEARIEKLQNDFNFMHGVAKKGGAPTMMQSVRRGISIRLELRIKRKVATRIQALWRKAWKRRQFLELRRATIVVQTAFRKKRVRRRLLQAVQSAQARRLRLVTRGISSSSLYRPYDSASSASGSSDEDEDECW